MSGLADVCIRLHESKELRWRTLLAFAFVMGSLMISMGQQATDPKCWYSALLVITAQMSDTVREFFLGEGVTVMDTMRYIFRGVAYEPTSKPSDMSAEEVQQARRQVGFLTLMPSAFITWIFAKSINNAASLGGKFGIVGGVAYAGWYTSFWSAAFVGYWIRTRLGFKSLPSAIEAVYGPLANLCFGLALFFRLWNEVWSNVLVVAKFYGEPYSSNWWYAATLSAAVPATYVIMGGMRASLVSDVLQAALGLIFLFIILGFIGHEMGTASPPQDTWAWTPPPATDASSTAASGGWMPGGWWCFLAACLQGFVSYPFHDPVLTDRTFLSRPRTMVASFAVGGSIAMMFIVLFSGVGIYACFLEQSVGKGDPVIVANHLGGAAEAFMTLVMMTSSLSTLDSTFTSTAKLFALEVLGWCKLPGDARGPGVRGTLVATDPSVNRLHIALGRAAIVFVCVLGIVFLEVGRETDALKATTVSGTMVMGLGPPVYLAAFWKYNAKPGSDDGWRRAPLAFFGSFLPGIIFGSCYMAAGWRDPNVALKEALAATSMGEGPYAVFLGWNVVGHCVCLLGCLIGFGIHQLGSIGPKLDAPPTVEDPSTGERVARPGYEALAAKQRDAEAASEAFPSTSTKSAAVDGPSASSI